MFHTIRFFYSDQLIFLLHWISFSFKFWIKYKKKRMNIVESFQIFISFFNSANFFYLHQTELLTQDLVILLKGSISQDLFFEWWYESGIRGVPWNAPKSMWKMIFSRDSIFIIFWNAPKSKNLIFGLKIGHVLIFRNAPLFYVRIFWNAPFFLSDSEKGKSGALQKISTWSILKQKGTENKIIGFWGISKNFENAITWKNPLSHAFWGISWYPPVFPLNSKISKPKLLLMHKFSMVQR